MMNSLSIYKSVINSCSCFALFLLDQVESHINEEIMMMNNTINMTWVNEYFCKNITIFKSEIKMNIFKNAFSFNFGIADMTLYIKNTIISFNEINSDSFLIWLIGYIFFQELKFMNNVAVNNELFICVFDIEMNYLFIAGSYFENNGLKTKKINYITFADNNLFSFWVNILFKIESTSFIELAK